MRLVVLLVVLILGHELCSSLGSFVDKYRRRNAAEAVGVSNDDVVGDQEQTLLVQPGNNVNGNEDDDDAYFEPNSRRREPSPSLAPTPRPWQFRSSGKARRADRKLLLFPLPFPVALPPIFENNPPTFEPSPTAEAEPPSAEAAPSPEPSLIQGIPTPRFPFVGPTNLTIPPHTGPIVPPPIFSIFNKTKTLSLKNATDVFQSLLSRGFGTEATACHDNYLGLLMVRRRRGNSRFIVG